MKKARRLFCAALCLAMVLTLLAGCGSDSGIADSSTTFSWWISTTVDPEYYTDYDQNPVIKYIEKNVTFESSDGKQVNINFDFQNGISGSEQDNFNNMMATGTYTDIIDPTYMTDTLQEMYESGKILDMTEYVEKYMPNYMAYIEAHPELKLYFTTEVDGEERFLSIPTAYESINMYDQWYGFCYRRDWIVKYGVQPDEFYDPMTDSEPTPNPNAGKAFSGCYTLDKDGNTISETVCTDNVNGDSWVDDVVFPSGHTDPVYISDWEWMLEIFEKALEAEGITDGYCMSLYYPGFVGTGDLVSGFGGIGPMWYLDENGECQFGAVTEQFKAYLECMNTWYEKGWIDQRFDQRSSDVFYQVDNTTVRQGKVGIWLGITSEILTRMQNEDLAGAEGIIAYTCASPINDVYGSEECQLKEPTCFSSMEMVSGSICVTDKAKDKDLKVLCEYLDYQYTEEGILLSNGGLNKEQAAAANDETYSAYNIEYAYDAVESDDGKTKIKFVDVLYTDEGGIRGAMVNSRSWRLNAESRYVYDDTETYTHMRENWVTYEATGAIGGMLNSRMSADDWATYQKVQNRIGAEFMYIEIPKFIKGTYSLTDDWDTFVTNLTKRNYQSVVDGYNRALGIA